MYKPREGQLSWFGHRVSGIAIFMFLFGHILSTSVIVWGPNGPAMHEKLDAFYRLPIFTLIFHPLLFAAVAFHALNGIRIVVVDWWSRSTGVHRQLFYAELVVFAVLMLTAVKLMILPEWNEYQKGRERALTSQATVTSLEGIR
jgi:succinate dehydrogenase / fumarate reductase, cytochrome b subunit